MTPRQQAKRTGAIKYTGKPCPMHGTTVRYTSNGSCVDCVTNGTVKMRKAMEDHLPIEYYYGYNARNRKTKKMPPGKLAPVMRYWWLAGWNDRDIELSI